MSETLSLPGRIIRLTVPAVVAICITCLQKFLFEETVDDSTFEEPHYFHKPTFQTVALSLGLCLVLLVSLVQYFIQKNRMDGRVEIDAQEPLPIVKTLLFAIVPGVTTMFGLFFTSVGLVWIDASYWQILALASVLFPSCFTYFVLKRRRGIIQLISIAIIFIGVVAVIIAAYKQKDDAGISNAGQNAVLGAIITLGGHCITSTVPVLEDWFYGGKGTRPTLIVGLEGLFSTIIAGAVLLPIASKGNPPDGRGISEDISDTFQMLKHSTPLLLSVLGLVVLGLLYGIGRAFIGPAASERALAIALLVQTVAVWIVQLILKAALRKGTYAEKHPLFGEEWTKWSYLELAGFVIAGVGVWLNTNVIPLRRSQAEQGVSEVPLMSE
jgi:drug/metabolite transporter (DMT)-like permease